MKNNESIHDALKERIKKSQTLEDILGDQNIKKKLNCNSTHASPIKTRKRNLKKSIEELNNFSVFKLDSVDETKIIRKRSKKLTDKIDKKMLKKEDDHIQTYLINIIKTEELDLNNGQKNNTANKIFRKKLKNSSKSENNNKIIDILEDSYILIFHGITIFWKHCINSIFNGLM